MSPAEEPHILLSPLGRIDEHILPSLRSAISQVYGLPTQIASLLQGVDFAYSPERRQYHSTSILKELAATLTPAQIKVLGICSVDLFIPILTHVFGEAELNGRASLISTYRLNEDLPAQSWHTVYLDRVVKEGLHELGHTFNLKHCPDPRCIMHYCRHIADVDHKERSLCRYCRIFVADALQELGLAERLGPAARPNHTDMLHRDHGVPDKGSGESA